MASSINTGNIDGAYPVAGQDNSSQGFRDNFTNIKTNFGYAKSELEDLQTKAVLKAGLTGVALDNDMGGNLLYNVEISQLAMSKYAAGVLAGSVTLDYSNGYYQTLTTSASITLAFTNFPASGKHAEMAVAVTVASVAHTVTLPAACTVGVNTVPGILANVITFPAAGQYLLKFTTDDNGTTIAVEYAQAPGIAGAIKFGTIAAAIGSAGDTTGMVSIDASYIYICTAPYDGSTAVWKRVAVATW